MTKPQIQDLDHYGTSDASDEPQRNVIRSTEQGTRNLRAAESLVHRLERFLCDRELVELMATATLANFANRFNAALSIEAPCGLAFSVQVFPTAKAAKPPGSSQPAFDEHVPGPGMRLSVQ